MNRSITNIIIDLLAALLFIGMIATGYLLRFPLPPGSNKTHSLWGLTRHQWGDVHFWISLGLLVVMLIHLALHWNWIVTVIGKRCHVLKSTQPSLVRSAVWTVVVFIAICVGFVWMAEKNIKELPSIQQGEWARHQRIHGGRQDSAFVQIDTNKASQPVWDDVYPILAKNCFGCHGPQRQMAGFRADVFEDYFGPGGKPALIVPGQSDLSPLITIISGQRTGMAMAEAHKLTEPDVARIKAWIDRGADNSQ